MSLNLGDSLVQYGSTCQSYVLLSAPFIEASVVDRFLKVISPDVNLQIITRWLPEEIAAGVNDLEVWHLLQVHPQSRLLLRQDLHAKYYRFDRVCLIGSANLTGKALGWSSSPNLELLVPLPADTSQLQAFEAELLTGCIEVDEGLYQQISNTVQLLKEESFPAIAAEPTLEHSDIPADEPIASWLPTLRNPEELYLAYSGQWERLTTVAKDAAAQDLRFLRVIPNLPPKAFKAYIGTLLLQHPLIRQVDAFVETPQRFGAVRNLIATFPGRSHPEFNANRAWQTLMRWLLYFLPQRYTLSVPRHSEVFHRIPTEL